MTYQEAYANKIKAILEAKGLTPTTKENQMQIIEEGYGGMSDPIKTKVPKGRVKDGKINISLNPETVEMLVTIKNKMGVEMGFNLTYSQAIQHLVKFYNQRTKCQGDTMSQPTEGESNGTE
jgi:hypothetical protein